MYGHHIALNISYSKGNLGNKCEPITRYVTEGVCLKEQATPTDLAIRYSIEYLVDLVWVFDVNNNRM